MKSAVAAAAATASSEQRSKRAVFAHAVCEGGEDGPAAAREYARREHVPARSENEQDDKNPKTAVASQTAIHSFSSFNTAAEYVIYRFCGRYIKLYDGADEKCSSRASNYLQLKCGFDIIIIGTVRKEKHGNGFIFQRTSELHFFTDIAWKGQIRWRQL